MNDLLDIKITRPGDSARRALNAPAVADLATWRERRAWEAAARWLNWQGLAAAVPSDLVPVLERRGCVVWPCTDRRAAA